MDDIWYYEYCIKIFDEEERKEVLRSGVVPAESMTEALSLLEKYYGEVIIAILYLTAILEGTVFEFELINDDSDNDIMIKSSSSKGVK